MWFTEGIFLKKKIVRVPTRSNLLEKFTNLKSKMAAKIQYGGQLGIPKVHFLKGILEVYLLESVPRVYFQKRYNLNSFKGILFVYFFGEVYF